MPFLSQKDQICTYTFVVMSILDLVSSKTIRGVVTSLTARQEKGQYLSSFCFHGEAVIQYSLNDSMSSGKLYLFLSEDWKQITDQTECTAKFEQARASYDIIGPVGNRTVAHHRDPRIWHVVFADAHTCTDYDLLEVQTQNFIDYNIQLLNPDALGNPVEHFSDEETGLLRFYQLLALAYFVLGCICVPRLVEPFSSGGPMQLVIQLLTASTCLQAVGAFIMMMHLRKYSRDGIGSPVFEMLSEFFDVLSQFAMLYMLLSLSLGWTLGTTYRNTHLQMISKKPAAKVVGVLAVVQGGLFLWEQYQDQTHRLYHAHRTYAGFALLVLRMVLAGLFGWNLWITVSVEKSIMKREFYISFTKSCMLWFLCYPVIVLVSMLFTEYLRYKVITMSVVLCQSVAVVLLYKLFLSRSLYWEVSALSGTLPFRMDKTLSLKIYS
ncbi:integral membrane protein GPR180-like [Mercenaria mercenaria]|uniref:integral membrane protein GPR180-like n=1 Tax=Mercenaria mercenaria TaxID=6596 RepID=UPI00234F3AFF|nr:integral membrane protein GPR180-like [Mercenaria mercenaria]